MGGGTQLSVIKRVQGGGNPLRKENESYGGGEGGTGLVKKSIAVLGLATGW